MKVINLFGGPGSGKSTQAAGLFYKMKCAGLDVELVTEYAKDLVWQDRLDNMLDQQDYIFAKQHHRLHCLCNKVDYVVTDSPIILGIVYMAANAEIFDDLVKLMLSTFQRYDNTNFLLCSHVPYEISGRMQTADDASKIGVAMERLITEEDIKHTPIPVRRGEHAVDLMFDYIINQSEQILRARV